MALEIVARFRCNRCGMAIEQLSVASVSGFPLRAITDLVSAPDNWTVRETVALCPQHSQLVEPARILRPVGVG